MSRVIALANQKGGVGKTTTCINLAASLAAVQCKVLLIDMDSQGNATTGLGVQKDELARSMYHVLTGKHTAQEALLSDQCGIDLLPANADLTAAEVHMMRHETREVVLQQALSSLQKEYEYILIDCPPSLSLLTLNALVAAGSVMIPMQCEYYALEGLSSLMKTIDAIRQSVNTRLRVEGMVRTMYDTRSNLAKDVSAQLLEYFGELVYATTIPRNVRLAESPSFGKPLLQYDRNASGARSYLALAGEMLRRHESHRLGVHHG